MNLRQVFCDHMSGKRRSKKAKPKPEPKKTEPKQNHRSRVDCPHCEGSGVEPDTEYVCHVCAGRKKLKNKEYRRWLESQE